MLKIIQNFVRQFTKMSNPNILHEVDTPFKKATFGMGCFWANDALYGACQGVLRTRVGYSGGSKLNPVYRNLGDHTEVIEIDYDPKQISYEELLDLFYKNHEYGLTTKVKAQYKSLILYHDDEQKEIAKSSIKSVEKKRNEKLITDIAPAQEFYPAEDYHQKYRLQRHSLLCDELGLNSKLLQTSHAAARLNGYVAGIGSLEDLEKDIIKLRLSEKAANYLRTHYNENKGGNLYC